MKTKTKHILIAVLVIWLAPAITQALYQPISIVTTLIQGQFATVFSSTYDTATPAGTDSPSEADDRMREIKAAVQERLAVEHRFALTGTEVSAADTGEHTDITTDSIVNAGTMTNVGTLGVTGDFAVNTDKFTVTATSGNTLVAGTLDVTGAMEVTGVATLGDASLLKTSAAPTTDAMIANMKYVDDSVPTSGFWTADGTKVFDGSAGSTSTYQDLDISAQVGSNSALVFLKVFATTRIGIDFRVNGETDNVQTASRAQNINQSAGASAAEISISNEDAIVYLVCSTDGAGILEWRASSSSTNVKIFVIGYVN